MTYEERIRRGRPDMSKSFAKLADFLLDSYIEAAFMTASELAQELNLDAATVVRFSQSLGYPGFPKLQREIRQRVKNNLLYAARQIEKDDSSATIVAGSLSKLSQLIEQTRISLDIRAFEALLDRINQSGRIVIVCESLAQPIGKSLEQLLGMGGYPVSLILDEAASLARAINNLSEDDLLVAIEVNGDTTLLPRSVDLARSKGIYTAAIVASASLASTRYADIVISAQSTSDAGVVCIQALLYALEQLLRKHFPDRYKGFGLPYPELISKLQLPYD